MPESLRAGLGEAFVDFSFFLDDLTSSTERELHQRAQRTAVARVALSVLRLGRTGQPKDIERWARLLLETLREADRLRAFETVLRYLAHVRDDDDDFIDVLVQATDDEEVEAIAMSYRDRLITQGREQGLEAGREGARRILGKLLRLKFGELDPETEQRLAGADLSELEAWSERVLTAETVDAVFEN